jgi:hypothetical protein
MQRQLEWLISYISLSEINEVLEKQNMDFAEERKKQREIVA